MKRYSLVYKYINDLQSILSRMGVFVNSSILVTKEENFDELLMVDHISASSHETFTLGNNRILRTHTTTFLPKVLRDYIEEINHTIASNDNRVYYTIGRVFRKDDSSRHLYMFNQLDGIIVGSNLDPLECIRFIMFNIIFVLLGKKMPFRIRSIQFPFTEMDSEVEILAQGKFIEVLGCGLVNNKIAQKYALKASDLFAFGVGIDRLVIINENVPTIKHLLN